MNEETSNIIRILRQLEEKAILLAMMTYNPSIGRVFKKDGVDKFIKTAWKMIQEIGKIQNVNDFDIWLRSS